MKSSRPKPTSCTTLEISCRSSITSLGPVSTTPVELKHCRCLTPRRQSRSEKKFASHAASVLYEQKRLQEGVKKLQFIPYIYLDIVNFYISIKFIGRVLVIMLCLRLTDLKIKLFLETEISTILTFLGKF